MRFIFKFPDIGEGITEGKILKWYVRKGQQIKSGDSVVKVETDKVVTDIPSPKEGIIVAVFGNEGEVIKVGDSLIEIEIKGINGEEAQAIVREKPESASTENIDEKGFGVVGTIEVAGNSAHLPASQEGLPEKKEAEKTSIRKTLATPVARAMAKDLGIDINKIQGTGPGGRVMKNDIQLFYEHKQVGKTELPETESPAVEYQDLSQIRKTIAKKMIQSKQSAAHMTVMEEVEVSELIKLKTSHQDQFNQKGIKLTYLPFILKAVTKALQLFPQLNSEIDMENNRMVYKKYYNIGIAVDTEDGLVVPVIRDVDKLSIYDLTQKIKEFSDKARERKLTLDDLRDGTFTVTNYGSIGGTFGVPVINYPQAAILGIGRIKKMPVVKDQEIVIGNILHLSLSVDHRIVDGGGAARFMLQVMEYLKDPVSMFLI